MQPLRPPADAQAGLVEAAHARGAEERADPLRDRRKPTRPPPRPFRHARRTKPIRPEQVPQRLGRAVLGDQLLRVEIDGAGSDALAVLGRPLTPVGKAARVCPPQWAQE